MVKFSTFPSRASDGFSKLIFSMFLLQVTFLVSRSFCINFLDYEKFLIEKVSSDSTLAQFYAASAIKFNSGGLGYQSLDFFFFFLTKFLFIFFCKKFEKSNKNNVQNFLFSVSEFHRRKNPSFHCSDKSHIKSQISQGELPVA